jgi:hypothetical protein
VRLRVDALSQAGIAAYTVEKLYTFESRSRREWAEWLVGGWKKRRHLQVATPGVNDWCYEADVFDDSIASGRLQATVNGKKLKVEDRSGQ